MASRGLTRAVQKAQSTRMRHLARCLAPMELSFSKRLMDALPPLRASIPERYGPYDYFHREHEGSNLPSYYRLPATPDARIPLGAQEQLLLDENVEGEGHPYICIGSMQVSPDHTKLAFSRDVTGAERFSLCVRELDSGQLHEDIVSNIFAFEWSADASVLFYSVTDPEHGRPFQVYAHRVGTNLGDLLVYEESDPKFFVDVSSTKDRKYIVISSNSKRTGEVHVIPSDQPLTPPRLIRKREHGLRYFVEHNGEEFLLITNRANNEEFQMEALPVKDAFTTARWRTLIPVHPDYRTYDADVFKDHIVLFANDLDGLPVVLVYDLQSVDGGRIKNVTGDPHVVRLPERVCTLEGGINCDFEAHTLRLQVSSPLHSSMAYDFDLRSKEMHALESVPSALDPERYHCERVHATSRDGVAVPLTVIGPREQCNGGTRQREALPTLLRSYGAYGLSLSAEHRLADVPLLEDGWRVALLHVRGGGELGNSWHRDGRGSKRWNAIHDYLACADHLVENNYSCRHRLAAITSSAGGTVVAAAANVRPDLLRAMILRVPFVDVLSTMTDPSLPLTVHEYDEWGNPDDPSVREYIQSYDPLLNLKQTSHWPATFVTASTLDTRVPCSGPISYIERLQALYPSRDDLVLKLSTDTGHFGEGGRYASVAARALELSFLHEFTTKPVVS
mmetsp:Transcript_42157/g.106366  ORF Transcript_42157/g.106366 Transcript_42157/m.106366 type:complete len:676 (-) Transcript_42157:315-2342(-)|eukprot:CAMPEP_0174240858 /NCGR_PEP_ID=MMETSP0417-20130205/20893_1 /TAXON_ID=242541 /ORGANISM="Mayorella sp, Strain BSH-02190019" /LENGTH=675 /DNA_ID=CAMNT_0015320021 /DNA_START=54 /DNA_END=2084 /DNA_ORIENTATION=+